MKDLFPFICSVNHHKQQHSKSKKTFRTLDLCQFILKTNKKLSNFLCGRTQIIIFATCSRECNVFSLG